MVGGLHFFKLNQLTGKRTEGSQLTIIRPPQEPEVIFSYALTYFRKWIVQYAERPIILSHGHA
jgi:hypothetical protein